MIRLQIQSDAKEGALDIVQAAISAEVKRLEIGLHRTERQIERFEKEYNVSSDVFQRDFAAEDMKKGDQEYIEWAGEIKVRERISRDLNNLKGIQYVAQ
ncbi:MAG: hypothetical protein Q7T53_00675 [Deltaproteobacteria bacterium]|nr:hypothetical protein [Deltaproteobacteria bacterium]